MVYCPETRLSRTALSFPAVQNRIPVVQLMIVLPPEVPDSAGAAHPQTVLNEPPKRDSVIGTPRTMIPALKFSAKLELAVVL